MREKVTEMLHFSSAGVEIAYIDTPPPGPDRGEPILLVHGFASNHMVNWVNTLWVRTLTQAGRRVIALDNRGHGQSARLYRPEDYATTTMARDSALLLDHLAIGRADVMGYSMGARIAAFHDGLPPVRGAFCTPDAYRHSVAADESNHRIFVPSGRTANGPGPCGGCILVFGPE